MQPINAKIYFPEQGIFGMAFLTDYEAALDAPDSIPGFVEAVINGMQMLGNKRLKATLVTYLNFRLQVWASGFDADATPAVRIIPPDIATDPNGPVTFPSVSL